MEEPGEVASKRETPAGDGASDGPQIQPYRVGGKESTGEDPAPSDLIISVHFRLRVLCQIMSFWHLLFELEMEGLTQSAA